MREKYLEICGLSTETTMLPTMIVSADLQIVYVNPAMEDTFGNLQDNPLELLFADSDILKPEEQNHIAVINAMFTDGIGGILKATLADVIYELRCAPVTYKDGEKFLVISLKDISLREHLFNNLDDTLKMLKKDTLIAKKIQNSILPINDEYWNSVRLSSIYLPTDDIGGDIFDIIKLPDGRILIYIADVSGHGIQASLLTMFIRENVRLLGEHARQGLDELARKLLEGFLALGISSEIYASILLCAYDHAARELAVLNAGHNCFPLIQRAGGRVEEIPIRGMPLTRISDGGKYEEELLGINPGDKLIMYTDGIVEEYSSAEQGTFSPEGVRKVVAESPELGGEQLAKKILDESAKYLKLKASDDRTIVVAEIL
jgi:sigma-B regulation protein RsbU (phosphoserine phosphatase)